MVLGSCVAAGACFGRDALGRPGSGSAIQRGADIGGVVVAVAAAGRSGVRVDSVRDGVLLVPRAVDVFLRSCSDKFCSPAQNQ